MLFVLKKIIGTLLLPLSLLLLIMAIGLILLWFSRWQKSAKSILTVSWLILLLLSLQPVADRLLQPIEATYPTRQQQDGVKYIVVLGGGYTWQTDWAPSANVAPNSLARITEAIRLKQLNPDAKLIFTGAAFIAGRPSTAEVGAYVAESLGVASSDIITLSSPKDTAEEADAVATYLGQQPFILVTSASHLPRAMREFHRAGLSPLAAPANQVAIRGSVSPWSQFLPSSEALTHSERAIYETLGRLWQSVRGLNVNNNATDTPTKA